MWPEASGEVSSYWTARFPTDREISRSVLPAPFRATGSMPRSLIKSRCPEDEWRKSRVRELLRNEKLDSLEGRRFDPALFGQVHHLRPYLLDFQRFVRFFEGATALPFK